MLRLLQRLLCWLLVADCLPAADTVDNVDDNAAISHTLALAPSALETNSRDAEQKYFSDVHLDMRLNE